MGPSGEGAHTVGQTEMTVTLCPNPAMGGLCTEQGIPSPSVRKGKVADLDKG